MAEKVIVNKQGIPQLRDFIYGALTAVATSLIPIIQSVIDSGELKLNFKDIATAAIIGFLGYLIKKTADKPSVKTIYTNNKDAENVAENITEVKP